jgi:hypothetical protein
VSYFCLSGAHMLIDQPNHKLPLHQKLLVQAFNFKVATDVSGITYSKLCRAFPDRLNDLLTSAKLRTRIGVIAGLRGTPVDCCVNLCVAFTSLYADEEQCLHCPKPRYKPDPHFPNCRIARQQFQYIPIIPQLIALYRNPTMACKIFSKPMDVALGLSTDFQVLQADLLAPHHLQLQSPLFNLYPT